MKVKSVGFLAHSYNSQRIKFLIYSRIVHIFSFTFRILLPYYSLKVEQFETKSVLLEIYPQMLLFFFFFIAV